MVIDELREQASNRGIQIISKLDREIEIIADQTQLMRALINLISNSISYGHDGGFAMLDLHRDVTNEDQVIINISDDGVGIAPEHLDKIFNRFYQADPSRTKQKSSNTGLGLPMVKQIIEVHGGKISVQSSLGAGSTFTVIIPAAVADNTL
jgi:signal transduction histidine kinase